jgi:hypothetical protein
MMRRAVLPVVVVVGLLVQFWIGARAGLLGAGQSYVAGADGEWLSVLATITGLTAVTAAIGGLLADTWPTRLAAVAAGLVAIPYVRHIAGQAQDVSLGIGGPANSATLALACGLVLAAVVVLAVRAGDRRPVAAALAVTLTGLWVMAAVALARSAWPVLGLIDSLFPVRKQWTAASTVAAAWLVIGAASAVVAGRLGAARAVAVAAGTLGAVFVSLSYVTARPDAEYLDHWTVNSEAAFLSMLLVGGALAGSLLGAAVPGKRPAAARTAQERGGDPVAPESGTGR